MMARGNPALLVILFLIALVGGCASEDTKAWKTAQAENSVSSIKEFIDRFPDSPHAQEAKREAARLSWLAIGSGGAIADYERFVVEFPDSEHGGEARAIIRKLKFPLEQQGFPQLLLSGRASTACGNLEPGAKTYEAADETPISADQLRATFGWDGSETLWKWSDKMSGVRMANGSVFALGPGTIDRKRGVPFEMGFSGEGFGDLCVGNLPVEGAMTFTSEGILLRKGTKISAAQMKPR